jgi:hypothetical protein
MARKPYPAIEGMRNVQRLLKTQNPRIGELNIEDLIDNRFIRKLDQSGFFKSEFFLVVTPFERQCWSQWEGGLSSPLTRVGKPALRWRPMYG